MKDVTKKHGHYMIHYDKCLANDRKDDHIRATVRRISEIVSDHAGKERPSHLLRNSIESRRAALDVCDYKIIW